MSSTALLLVDIQNDYFESGRWPVENMEEVAANAASLLAHGRETGIMIVHIRHESPSAQAPFFRPGSRGAQIHPCVAPRDGESVILKHRPNSFHDTRLKALLDEHAITDLVICGAMSQMCIDSTTRAAVDLGYKVMLVEDACGAKEQLFRDQVIPAAQVHGAFMAPLAMSFARLVSTETVLKGS
ncbi:MAG TPA: cysteine hydrolase [Rhizobiales bacterium]|nr:cysteine hydrolase [Hyphomicrobiales bacterium]